MKRRATRRNPDGLTQVEIVGVVGLIAVGGWAVWKQMQGFQAIGQGAGNALGATGRGIGGALGNTGQAAGQTFSNVGSGVQGAEQGIGGFFSGLGSNVHGVIGGW